MKNKIIILYDEFDLDEFDFKDDSIDKMVESFCTHHNVQFTKIYNEQTLSYTAITIVNGAIVVFIHESEYIDSLNDKLVAYTSNGEKLIKKVNKFL